MKQSEIDKIRSSPEIASLQKLVDQLRDAPDFKQYVARKKMALLDSNFQVLDTLLILGILV